jgi:uncharacterized protein (UPF0261 family)
MTRHSSENQVKSGLQILLVGTADTKADELLFMRRCIEAEGGAVIIMDVGVLGSPAFMPEIRNVDVAAAAGTTLDAIVALGDENLAMVRMTEGAVKLTLDRCCLGEVHGILVLGGTMGTDLALDVTAALPLGMPKMIVSTVAFSHLIAPERLAPDLMMILWAGGLYGLNSICQSILSQAAGAVLGACSAVVPMRRDRPRVAVSSLGKSCLSYMVQLKPALEQRGYEPVVFHCTGMGGRAMETLIEQGEFVAVFDFCLAEVANQLHGSVVTAGESRLEAAGRRGIPQLVAPGASDMVDVQSWLPVPAQYASRPYHTHNRLIGSVGTLCDERRATARAIAAKLALASGPTAFLLPRLGIHAWDREGQPMHEPTVHAAFAEEFRQHIQPPTELHDLELHINDQAFLDVALSVFDRWVDEGHIPRA